MKSKLLTIIVCALLCIMLLAACGTSQNGSEVSEPTAEEECTLTVVATLFPPYDFAREVGGDRVTVIKMIPAGAEAHTYEPTPADIITVDESDVFLYTNDAMEPWIATLAESLDESDTAFVNTGEGIEFLYNMDDYEGNEEDKDHMGAFDPHIWTDPTLAMVMVDNIAAAFSAADPDGAAYYAANAENYKAELEALDASFCELVADAERTEVVFGGEFAFLYFCEHYGLTYQAAFDSCAGHAEPSAKRVAELINEVETKDIPVVYYESLSNPTVAESIATEAGATTLPLYSCHNVSKEDMDSNVTYLELMERNLENLREGLN